MIIININNAKNILKDKIRRDRAPILQQLDIEYLRSLENNNIIKQQEIISKKQKLRDATKDPRIDNAQTPDDLKSIDPIKELGY